MSQFVRDLVYGLRTFTRNPALTVVAVLAIGVAIGANTIVFSIVNTSLLHPMPVGDPDGLVILLESVEAGGEIRQTQMTDGNFVDYQREVRSLSKLVAARSLGMPITSSERPLNPLMRKVSAGYFSFFGVEPLMGREFGADEDRPNGPPRALLSYGFWQDFFGGDPAIVGKTIDLDEVPYEIVGVIPAGFRDPGYTIQPVLWLPLALSADEVLRGNEFRRGQANIGVFGRIAEGRSLDEVRTELNGIAGEPPATLPGSQRRPRHHSSQTSERR